ncbi:MAG: alpha/beta fold hydrolase, partial [Pseudomonadota bacterium]
SIEPKAFDMLTYLITHRERVISKDELVEHIWKGRFVSDAAISSVLRDLRRALQDDGQAQRFVKTIRGHGLRFVAEPRLLSPQGFSPQRPNETLPAQYIRYCKSKDGTRIAYAISGKGPPLVKTGHWLTHLDFDWESPVWRDINLEFVRNHTLIRYDARGNGMSDWDVSDFSFKRQVEDLESVVDAAGIDHFSLVGISQAAATSVAYAARHPERVNKLVLLGGYDRGWRKAKAKEALEAENAVIMLIETQWHGSLAVAELVSATLMPDAPEDHWKWFSDLQRKTTTGRNAAELLRAIGEVDVRADLPNVKAPSLVLHSEYDRDVGQERGRNLALGIPDARIVMLDSRNHILHPSDKVWHRAMMEIHEFLDD